jgi:glycosyltransferase involved in cell wall biosynthesis
MIVPRLKYAITVNQSIADLYDEEYHTKFVVVRNMPIQNQVVLPSKEEMKDKLGLPADKKIIILQGAGINIDRGAEEVVKAMRFFDDVLLLIVGDGDVVPSLKLYVEEYQLQHKVRFFPKQNYEQLLNYTLVADLGVSLDKDSNMNYRFSLPNKIFDYIQAEIPLLVSNLTEVRRIVEQYDIGVVSMTHDPAKLASLITQTVNNEQQLKRWKQNLIQAKKELTWKHEKIQFNKLIASIGK